MIITFMGTLRMESLPPGRKSTAMRASPDLFTFTSATSKDGGAVWLWLKAGMEDRNKRTAATFLNMQALLC
jgi:hypothetical protein